MQDGFFFSKFLIHFSNSGQILPFSFLPSQRDLYMEIKRKKEKKKNKREKKMGWKYCHGKKRHSVCVFSSYENLPSLVITSFYSRIVILQSLQRKPVDRLKYGLIQMLQSCLYNNTSSKSHSTVVGPVAQTQLMPLQKFKAQ